MRADPAGTIGWEVLVTGAYERSMIEAARREVGSDGTATVIDVGAGIGTFSVAMLHVAGTVVSVEPSAALATGLEATRAMNRIGTRSWHIARCSLDDQADEPGCEVMTLDDLAARLDLSNVSLVKIGVEGMEVACLRGGRHVVRAHRPALLFEFDPSRWSSCGYTASDMGEILGDAGYQAYRVAARDGVESVPARFDPSLARGNFLAVPEGLVRHG